MSNQFKNTFKVNVSILDGIATIYYVAIYRLTIKSVMSYWKLGFHHESRLGMVSLPIPDTLAYVSRSHLRATLGSCRAGPQII